MSTITMYHFYMNLLVSPEHVVHKVWGDFSNSINSGWISWMVTGWIFELLKPEWPIKCPPPL